MGGGGGRGWDGGRERWGEGGMGGGRDGGREQSQWRKVTESVRRDSGSSLRASSAAHHFSWALSTRRHHLRSAAETL